MPWFPELAGPLHDGWASVRFAAERDIPEVLIAYQDDPDLHHRMAEERPPSGAELGRRTERAEAERRAGRGLTLTVLQAGDDICRGQIYVHQVDWENLQAELGIWISPGWRSQGMGRRSLVLVGAWLLRECGLERVHVLTEPDNTPMLHAARAAGFSYEGVLRAYLRERTRRIDAAMLSLITADLGS